MYPTSKSRDRKNFKSRKSTQINNDDGRMDENVYKFAVQFYKTPPLETISLAEFEQFALDRLAMLRIIENAGLKFTRLSGQYRTYILDEVRKKKELLCFVEKSTNNLDSDVLERRRKDHISHYILRLAYSRSEELRRWFIKHEVELFQFHLSGEESYTHEVLRHNGLYYEPILEDEKETVLKPLTTISKSAAFKKGDLEKSISQSNYFKIPFYEAVDLVGARKVCLKDGFAYVSQSELAVVVGNLYRIQLSHALGITARLIPQMEEDDRLLSILKGINDRYLGQDFGKASKVGSGDVTPEMIDQLSKTSFPMCMRIVHEGLREKHHLKHHGRLVYGLFLKALGLSLEDAQRFFREEFLRSMDIESYEKKGYSYNIRYNYGAEGKKTNFTPYSCSAIITKNAPGPGDVHGCPYRHFDKNILSQRLQAMHVSKPAINEIVDLAVKGHYQLACTKHFEYAHSCATLPQPINHPNYYYEESRKLQGRKDGSFPEMKERVRPTTQRSVVYPKHDSVADGFDAMDSLSQEELDTLSELASQEL